MTYASQQLADALLELELAKNAETKKGYSVTKIPTSIDARDSTLKFPEAVAKFLETSRDYSASTKAVSLGVY